ncbi:MAG: polysaccharide deacetylase family protein [Clostridia bacterium]|nr:polysaccharide deacetylase family protein [Clostridia bacterium]
MMKKKTIRILIPVLLTGLFASCGAREPDKTPLTVVTEGPSSAETDTFTELATDPPAAPAGSERLARCFYGDNTGTDKTYTGLEPLPLSDFGQPSFENTKGLSRERREHAYGVAENETPHEISRTNQAFFDEHGYDAVCLDVKTTEKVLYLTFDCGYENGYTAKILDTLRDKGVKAAFFCTLPQMQENPELIARMITEGHIVGNHSVTHPDFSELTRSQMYEELKGFDDYLREHFGFSAGYFRYPMGKYSEDSLDMLNSMGYKCVFWSLAYADWDLENQKGAQAAFETVMSRIHPGAVMLLHAISPENAGALGDIIDAARQKGYTFRMLSDLK